MERRDAPLKRFRDLGIDVVDGAEHLEQVSVRRDSAGRGLGRSLVDTVAIWALSH